MRLSYEFENVLGAVYHRGTIKFAPDASSIFSPVGNKIVVYDLKSSKSSALPFQVNYNINQICIHPRSTILLAASEKSHLYMISLTCGRLLHMKEYKSFPTITNISFSPDGRYYCVCGDNLVLIYITPGSIVAGKGREITPFRLLKKCRINHDTIKDVSWTADSKYVCIASQDISLSVIHVDDRDKSVIQLIGHSDAITSCYFANRHDQDRMLYSLTKNCNMFVWEEQERSESEPSDDEDDDEENNSEEPDPEKRTKEKKRKKELRYYRSAKHYLKLPVEPEETPAEKARRSSAYITASDYNSSVNLMVLGYNTGHYSLFEMPSATLIYDLDSNSGLISSISINRTGDWIAFGSSVDPEADLKTGENKTSSRLFVWEWQSKSHVLDQYGSGATMSNMHECVSYSLDGTHVVSGNLAGKIKVWSGLTGETVASFGDEHVGPIKAIKFAPNKSGKVIVSASLDGTLRAYDLNKFKNFRTFQSSVPDRCPEFVCLDIDSTGEFIAAGTYNYFEIYLYSLQTGKFLEYLTGHEGPVSGVAFSPVSNLLVSTSWDQTVRIWSLFEGSKCMRDTITFSNEVITVAFRPDGNEFVVSLRNGQITFFNVHNAAQIGAPIEGAGDLGTTQLITEASRDSKKFFLTLSYSADGSYLIAGGNSNYICIYHAQEKLLVKKIAITFNMSFDGIFDYVSNRRRKEFGYNLELLEQRQEERTDRPIRLPGVRKGDLGDRQAKPVIAVCQMVFSPTMRSFAAATTEGVLVYSLDVSRHFDPYRLAVDVDPDSIKRALKSKDFGTALTQTIQLNDKRLFLKVIESIPLDEMESITASLEIDYVRRVLDFMADILPQTRHLEYYLLWIKVLLYKHGMTLKNMPSRDVTPTVRALHQNMHRLLMDIKQNSDYSKYSLEYLTKTTRGPITTNDDDETLMDCNRTDLDNTELSTGAPSMLVNGDDEMCE
uniref:Periodic tryptophan protein 2 n=1 Tax=Aceria tosichella TaxID=561515 RepID=A0A6G1SCJ6_9ACAR